ncbi:centrosomal protein CCDC61-like isoform X2 [Biomphalaria glabrata]|uniref:Centrosomal protein CCDC61 n=1 Tax=Biomphalaria glabrata TaxID=6526 RepID=A0A9W2ZUF1_BIOGL|nr:centrosomal protein CCDC61-like isoform X2 [Biomphalaria glabrata]
MEEPLDIAVSCPYNIRGSDYIISLECKGSESLTVQVEDRLSADQWRSSFDVQYIEDLTHKTGNFKQFSIFVNMLESAITKSSESVSLDLLTYSDLETLRQKKSGISSSVKSSIPASRAALTTKRYLILTYTVEFDRIHYPLPLPYVGKPDPRVLQEEIRSLREELKKLRLQHPHSDSRTEKLLRDYRRLEREKIELEEEFAAFRREVRLTTGGNAVKDIRALKTMVRNLEEQLMKEKTKYQRTTIKRSQEYKDLLEEVEELRSSERTLRVRVKSLTNELAMLKRGRPLTRVNSKERHGSGDRLSATRNLSASRNRSLSNDRLSGRPGSAERTKSRSRERPPLLRSNSSEQVSRSSLNGSGLRGRSTSLDRNTSANRSRLSVGSGSNRSRSPSPLGPKRFNPTAYVKEKTRKQKETEHRIRKDQRLNSSGLSSRSRRSGNSSRISKPKLKSSKSLIEAQTSNHLKSSTGSQGNGSDGYGSDGSYTGTVRQRPGSGNKGSGRIHLDQDSPASLIRTVSNRPPNGRSAKQLASTPDSNLSKTKSKNPTAVETDDDSEYYDRSAEISEIDERLDRLQQLMRATMQ